MLSKMSPERWLLIKELLAPALEMDSAERKAYVDRVSSADASIREDLERYLAAQDNADSGFLREPARLDHDDLPPDGPSLAGVRVGAYLTVEEIGAGGMGEVYRAYRADDQYRKEVAIKLVRAGRDSGPIVRRFKNERQILASLDHPNIARLLDGGTIADGSPYFVMELIAGLPLDEYCDHQRLTISERLRLFLQVCAAVQFAHQHLIIHRDIKPSNILVTSDGMPKLLDFGIAKILDPAAADFKVEPTRTIFRALTPGYASPEQVAGGTITTASDVYSLGVVLYELLAGRSPYRRTGRTPQEIAQLVCDIEPERPGAAISRIRQEENTEGTHGITPVELAAARQTSPDKLKKFLEGDLDNIVLMALRKEPQRRYGSADQLARDIERHLENLPVLARKDTLGYRTSKFLTRHKAGVAGAAAFLGMILLALTFTLREAQIARRQAQIAQEQRARAERRFNDVRKLANSLIFDLHDPIRELPGSTPVLKKLMDTSLQYLDSLAQEAEGDSSLQREVAAAYKRLGDAQGRAFSGPSLGDSTAALVSYRRALLLRETLVRNNPFNISDQTDLAVTHRIIGAMQLEAYDLQQGRDELERALKIIEPIAKTHPDNIEAVRELSADLTVRGEFEFADRTLALPYHRRALEIVRQLAQMQPDEPRWQRSIAYEGGRVAYDLALSGRPREAVEYARQALRILEPLSKTPEGATNAGLTSQLMATHYHLGNAWLLDGNSGEAVNEFRAGLVKSELLAQADPKNVQAQIDLGELHLDLGVALADHDRPRAGLGIIIKGLEILEKQSATHPLRSDTVNDFGDGHVYKGQVLEKLGDLVGALHVYDQARNIFESPAISREYDPAGVKVAAAQTKIAGVLYKLGKFSQAQSEYESALPVVEAASTAIPVNSLAQYLAADIYAGLGDLAAYRERYEPADEKRQACTWYGKSLESWRRLPLKKGLTPNWFVVVPPAEVVEKQAACTAVQTGDKLQE